MGKSLIAQQYADTEYVNIPKEVRDEFEMGYDAAKQKLGRTIPGKSEPAYHSKEDYDAAAADLKKLKEGDEPFKKEAYQPVQKAFKDKSWNEIKTEYNGKGDLIAKAFAEHPEYEAGPKTKEGMKELGYSQDDKGAWVKDDPQAQKVMSSVTDENGNVNPQKAQGAAAQYEQKLIDMGAGEYDINGNFHLKPTNNKKGWETWATMLSVALSAIGIAAGVPIIPINFKAITGKDTRDAQIQALQQQYMNLQAGDAGKVGSMWSDIETGNMALKNQDALAAQEKHAASTAAQKDVIGAQTKAQKDVMRTETEEVNKRAKNDFERKMKEKRFDQNERLFFTDLEQKYGKEIQKLMSDLNTQSAIDVMKYQSSGAFQDINKMLVDYGKSWEDLAIWTAARGGITPTDKFYNNLQQAGSALMPFAK